MTNLIRTLEQAEAEVRRIKQQIAGATCAEVGHDWKHIGGANAGCLDECTCSVPVHTCTKCGDCDYGENLESSQIRNDCEQDAALRPRVADNGEG